MVGAGHTKGDVRGGVPLRRLWPVNQSHRGRDTPEGTAARGGIHARAEEMNKKEEAMTEKGKKQGVAKNHATH